MSSSKWPPLGSSGGIASINGDTTAAQIIVGAGTVSVMTSGGTTTITGSGGGGSPAGSSGDIQYNNSGSFGSDANFTRNPSTFATNINVLDGSGNFAGINVSLDYSATPAVEIQSYLSSDQTGGCAIVVANNLISLGTSPTGAGIVEIVPTGYVVIANGSRINSEVLVVNGEVTTQSITAYGTDSYHTGDTNAQLSSTGVEFYNAFDGNHWLIQNSGDSVPFVLNSQGSSSTPFIVKSSNVAIPLQTNAAFLSTDSNGNIDAGSTIPSTSITGLGTAAALNATYIFSGFVAGVSGSFTGNNLLISADSQGTVADSGIVAGTVITTSNFSSTLTTTAPISSGITGTFTISSTLGGSVSIQNGVITSWTAAT